MNQDNQPIPIQPEVPNQAQVPPATVQSKPGFKQLAKDMFNKIYTNKKIFWLLVSLFSLILLIIIIGTIFKLMGGKTPTPVQQETPTPQGIETLEEKKEPLDLAKEELVDLEKQLQDFDINQKRLQPPSINFKIEF
jgi:flagellar biosynthesis/type III secretory pathway M-ring protein FliF/YscJ